jgi:hypothetical protein
VGRALERLNGAVLVGLGLEVGVTTRLAAIAL